MSSADKAPSLGGLTFYQHRGVRVTRRGLSVDGASYDLRAIGGMFPNRQRSTPVLVSAVVAAGSMLAATAYAAVNGIVWLVAVGSLAIIAVAVTGWVVFRRSESHELWLRYRGEHVLVFTTRDGTDFAKVCRALQRALDASELNM